VFIIDKLEIYGSLTRPVADASRATSATSDNNIPFPFRFSFNIKIVNCSRSYDRLVTRFRKYRTRCSEKFYYFDRKPCVWKRSARRETESN